MTIPLQISYRGLDPSDAVSRFIRAKAGRLERFYGRIGGCRVLVEQPHRHHHSGRHFHVRIDLMVPGGELVVEREPALRSRHKDVNVAVSDAFRAARRQLEDYVRGFGSRVKPHAKTPHARVERLFPQEGFGFLEDGGRSIYFHRNSVLHGAFDRLRPGSTVRFCEESGAHGPQASTVELLRAPRT
jgi:cold shock CspA family protein